VALPPDLAAFLKDQPYACLTHRTNVGTVLVAKLPATEIESIRGTTPVQVRHELHALPMAPVIRMVLSIYDQPDAPLALETFVNVADPEQRADYADLIRRHDLRVLFYDEALSHRLTKRLRGTSPVELRRLLSLAERLRATIHPDRYDFDAAKAAVLEQTAL